MNVVIDIHYVVNDNKVLQRGSFPTKRRKHEIVAFEWWKQIKREMNVDYLEKVIADAEDITDKVMELEKASYSSE
ncbi:hypothetical protein [Bacillus sp. ISL-46]|uniref:hypothetical protein n=1 Tax=Bacillus sp. ISL-46 TaxID=2819129 RepID=UPI001BE9903C|nr:hypothetical protein [Bacillus sp. ISL-46]MBT2723037.1 hypothetical protein [Bacillus sp. ISL-46]